MTFSDMYIGKFMGFGAEHHYFQEIVNDIFLPIDYGEKEAKDEDGDLFTKITLETTVEIAKKRLEIFGVNLEKAECRS